MNIQASGTEKKPERGQGTCPKEIRDGSQNEEDQKSNL